jgi:hypothetical protein
MNDTNVQQDALSERYRRNAALLGASDVVVASVPGSGSSLFSTLALELGFQHLDQYFNVLHTDGTVETDQNFRNVRSRMSGYAVRDNGSEEDPVDQRARFFRTHLLPDAFDLGALHGAVILVRDPRDAVHSMFQYMNKATGTLPGLEEKKTFPQFLDEPGPNGTSPVRAWTQLYHGWLDARPSLRRFAVVQFADLKSRPIEAVADMLAELDLEVSPDRIARAVERSSFESMRAYEDKVAAGLGDGAPELRMMRRGKVNEWQEWFTPEIAGRFADAELIAVARELGHLLPGAQK